MEIDVKKCPHYEDEICYNEGVLYKYCNQCDDCMYKTFQQLKAENEALKDKIKIMSELYDNCINSSYKYKNALDEIEEMYKNTELYECCEYAYSCKYKLDDILQKIKEVKGNE